VLRTHKLVPVPVDIRLDTLEPQLHLLEQAARAGTRPERTEGRVVAILVAQLYGRRCDMEGVVAVAKKYNLQLIEDLAETFSSLSHIGHPACDLSFLSFGSIKIATAFGAGVARVRDAEVWSKMQATQEKWAVQARSTFFSKCVKNTLAMLVLNVPFVTGNATRIARAVGWDIKAAVVSLMRGFPDREKLMERLREQPSSALLAVLHRRLRDLDVERFQLHQDKCDLLIDLLPSSPSCQIPGYLAPVRNHWLLPVLMGRPGSDDAADVAEIQRLLNENGVDAYRGATQLALVPLPEEEVPGKGELVQTPGVAADMMARTLYLPMHRAVPERDIVRMAAVMHRVVQRMEQQQRGANLAAVSPPLPLPSKL